jgi:hypothetical protein
MDRVTQLADALASTKYRTEGWRSENPWPLPT